MNLEFKLRLKEFRENLRSPEDVNFYLSYENLGFAIGLSKQHLQNLENLKQTNKPYNISIKKLKDLILFLSLKQLEKAHIDFIKIEKERKNNNIDNLRKVTRTSLKIESKGFFGEHGYPLPFELDLKKLQILLFLAIDIENLKTSFIPSGQRLDDYDYIKLFINKLNLDSIPIDKINHDYEVWTLSDVLGEKVLLKAAESTALNIVKYKVKYRNFVPIHDEIQWKIAYKNVEKYVTKLLMFYEEKGAYWKKDDWKNYWVTYGLSEIAFCSKFRIYNARNPNAMGNYNVGSVNAYNIELVEMLSEDISNIRRKLNYIIDLDSIGELGKGPYPINALSCYVDKKTMN